eukprot:Phypoly_transcript_01806.p1 GENE.Phypoly_transcript_01806~~Phypoly_transcript_01806.p1  ORF type:complete len:745 (+),score=107.08 Phypoly_transcript_01806:239-2236(+)
MAHCEVHRDTNSTNKREFTIHYTTTGRIYYLIAGSEQEVNFWVAVFMEWKGGKRRVTDASTTAAPRPITSPRSHTITAPRTSPTRSVSPPSLRANGSPAIRATPPPGSSPATFNRAPARTQSSRDVIRVLKEDVKPEKSIEIEEKLDDLMELGQRLLTDVQDVHSVRKVLQSFHRPLAASDTQYLSLQIIRQMEYLNVCLQEVSNLAVKDDERSDFLSSSSDEYIEEAIEGHFFLLPSGLAYYLFSFLEPRDLSRACQVCRTWKTYGENPALWAQFMATPSSKYDNQRNWKALYISTHQPKNNKSKLNLCRGVSVYGSPPTSFEGSVKEGWLHKRNEGTLKMWKRRWFVIRENCLIYYKTPKDNLPCGVIPLLDITFSLVKGTGRKHCFKLSNKSKRRESQQMQGGKVECVLSADSDEECLSWVSELRNNMAMSRTAMPTLQTLTSEPRNSVAPALTRTMSAFALPEKQFPFFGVTLKVLMDRQKQAGDECKIPAVIDKALNYLEEKALNEEGLLRISGSLAEIQTMRAEIEQGHEISFKDHDPHAVTGLIKCFFRELPERLIPADLNNYAATVAADTSGVGTDSVIVTQKLEEFRFILRSLPVHNHNLLRALVRFLVKLSTHAHKNKMNDNNILRVIIPTIHCNPQLIAYSMRHFDVLFVEGFL